MGLAGSASSRGAWLAIYFGLPLLTVVRERLPFEIPAIVLLPDHLHCIWSLPADDDDFPERWRQIKGRFSHDYLAAGGRD